MYDDARAAVTSKAPPQARGAPAGVTPSRGRIAARPSSLPMVSLQARLEVGSVDDPLEHEAERVAGHVMRMPAPGTPPRCACRGTPGPDGECAACKASRVARLAIIPAVPALRSAPASVGAALSAPGRPLDVATRAFFESRLDTDLSAVRIHDDATAAVSAHDVAAQAYTVGRDVVFGAGRYQPSSEAGRALLAHELAHVVQQNSGRTTPSIQRKAQTYTVRPDHAPLSAEEVLILMAMTSRKVSRAAAIKLIADDEIACGEHPACLYGVRDMKPIQFTIGHPEPQAKHPAPAKQAAPKKAAKPPVAPDPVTVDIGEQPAPPAQLPADVESALDNPHLKRFFTIGTQEKFLKLPRGQPNPDDYAAVNYVRDALLRLNEKELTSYRGFIAGQTLGTWTDIARSLHEFSKIKTGLPGAYDVDTGPVDRFRGADPFYELIKRREVLEKAFKELPHISSSSASVLVQPTAADVRNRARYEELGSSSRL
ncbi:MAG: eCIS core domain-containing protein [Methylocella sp.]